jgi:hypothetical protein
MENHEEKMEMKKPKQYINTSKKQFSQKNKISHKPLHTNAVQYSKSPYQQDKKNTTKEQILTKDKEILSTKKKY